MEHQTVETVTPETATAAAPRPFPTKDEARIRSAIGKLFEEVTGDQVREAALLTAPHVRVVDAAHVAMIEALTPEAKLALRPFIHPDLHASLVWPKFTASAFPMDSSSPPPEAGRGRALFSTDYLFPLLRIFEESGEAVTVEATNDCPLLLANKHFRALLAPRIETV